MKKAPALFQVTLQLAGVACICMAILATIFAAHFRLPPFGKQQERPSAGTEFAVIPVPTIKKLAWQIAPPPAPPSPENRPTVPPSDNIPALSAPTAMMPAFSSPDQPVSAPLPAAPGADNEPTTIPQMALNLAQPEHPATRLIVPALNLDLPVVLAPVINEAWKVDDLGMDIGHLQGTASPEEKGNVVLAGHVTLDDGSPGPFVNLAKLKPGDKITVFVDLMSYTYRVERLEVVDRSDVQVVYPSADNRLTLITCTSWNNEKNVYQQRVVVTALPII